MDSLIEQHIARTPGPVTTDIRDVHITVAAKRARPRRLKPAGLMAVMPINSDADIVGARERGRALAGRLGFSARDRVLITTAISELARNIVLYAERGEIRMGAVQSHTGTGMNVLASDNGPGIHNVESALRDGFSTSGGLGLGLPGVRRLMDDFEIESRAGAGTAVRVTKWLRARSA